MRRVYLVILIIFSTVIILVGIYFIWQRFFRPQPTNQYVIESQSISINSKPVTLSQSILENKFGFLSGGGQEAGLIKKLGASWVRPHPGPFLWGRMQASANTGFDFTDTDKLVKNYQQDDLGILATIWPFADWDQKNLPDADNCKVSERDEFLVRESRGEKIDYLPQYRCNPNNWQAYQAWVTALVERYDGDGTNDMPTSPAGGSGLKYLIKHWEVMNEPDLNSIDDRLDFYKQGPEDYAELLIKTSQAIHRADENAKVLIAGAAGGDEEFLNFYKKVLTVNGVKETFDIGNVHTISNGDYDSYNVQPYQKMLVDLGISKPIWVTEAQAILSTDENINASQTYASTKKALELGAERIFYTHYEFKGGNNPPRSNIGTPQTFEKNLDGSDAIKAFQQITSLDPIIAQNGLADSPWPTYKGNNQHTGFSPETPAINQPKLKWRFDIGGGIEDSPAIGSDGTIYIGAYKDNFFALNPDGSEKWRFTKEGEEFRSSPTIAQDSTIYVGAVFDLKPVLNVMYNRQMDYGVPKLYALNPDGSLKWQFITGGILGGTYNSPAVGPDGTIYIGGGGKLTADAKDINRLWAINPDGTAKWYFEGEEAFYSSVAIADDGTIYIGCGDGNVYALTPDGKEKWRFTRKEGDFSVFDSTPVIAKDGTIYAGSTNKNLYAITPEGKEKWHFTALDMVEASPSLGPDGTIYVGTISKDSKDKNLYALNPDGSEKWHFTAGDGISATPAIDKEGNLYFGSYDGNLYAFSSEGKELWRYKTAGGITFPPTLDKDSTIYVGSWDHYLYALGDEKKSAADTVQKTLSPKKPNYIKIYFLPLSVILTVSIVIFIYIYKKKKSALM